MSFSSGNDSVVGARGLVTYTDSDSSICSSSNEDEHPQPQLLEGTRHGVKRSFTASSANSYGDRTIVATSAAIPTKSPFSEDQSLDEDQEHGQFVSKRSKLQGKDDRVSSENQQKKVPSIGEQDVYMNGRKGRQSLSIPSSIQNMFGDGLVRKWVDNPEQHDKRVRSFPHVEGNWATHVYIPVQPDPRFVQFVDNVLDSFQPYQFEIMKDFHISLSRTVVIRHHWIEALVDSLRDNITCLQSCLSDLKEIKLYTNDEKTRTFVCLEVSREDTFFLDYMKAVDKSFAEFKLPQYYKNPSFHISVGWCSGDVTQSIPEEQLNKVKEILGLFCASHPDLSVVYVQQVCCKSGNKSFFMSLLDSD